MYVEPLDAAYRARSVFAFLCRYAADRFFVLADLGAGADALAEPSADAFADALVDPWARADALADVLGAAVVPRS